MMADFNLTKRKFFFIFFFIYNAVKVSGANEVISKAEENETNQFESFSR